MAVTPTLFRTYLWLANIIRRSHGISLKEINEQWVRTEQSRGVPFHRNTFYSHLRAIEDMFDVNIECDRRVRGGSYHFADNTSLHDKGLSQWVVSTMSVAGAVKDSNEVKDRILLERVPSGDHLLSVVTYAMKKGQTLRIRYRKFIDAEPYETEIEPYCVKLFRQRWYMLAHRKGRDYLAIYAFDRMEMAKMTDNSFSISDQFDAERYFKNLFGIFQPQPNEHLETIIIRTYNGEWNYLRTLPLHGSQKELQGTEEYIDFSICVYPTRDLKLELLSRGANVEVVKPLALRREMADMIRAASKRYSRKKKS